MTFYPARGDHRVPATGSSLIQPRTGCLLSTGNNLSNSEPWRERLRRARNSRSASMPRPWGSTTCTTAACEGVM